MSEDEPTIIDNRAEARAKRRRDSLYDNDPDASFKESEAHLVRTTPVRWGDGADPALDADELHGFQEYKLEVLEHPTPNIDRTRDIKGTPSSVRCFHCRHNDYLIVGRLSREERIERATPEVQWAVKQNRDVDPFLIEPAVSLFCPGCKAEAQMLESQMEDLKHG